MTDKLPAALLCPIDGCETLTAIGTVDTMCQKHWNMASPRLKWRVYDVCGAFGGELLRRRQQAVVDEVNDQLRGRMIAGRFCK